MARIAIIGSGISGLGCAHFLHPHHDVSVYESDSRIGGHAHTVDATESGTGRRVPIDTGFMVFNHETYPYLCSLFDHLQVPTRKTTMSFSVRDDSTGLEWNGTSLDRLFAQRRNLFNGRFLKMLWTVNRFNQEAATALEDPALPEMTLAQYVASRGYGDDFFNLYLMPMSSAVWSAPPARMRQFPAISLLRFFHNHGFLGRHTQHQWWTPVGGSRTYVERLIQPFKGRIQVGQAATRIVRIGAKVIVQTSPGEAGEFDAVIMATHADIALQLLHEPTPAEARILGCFAFQPNTATLHTDPSVMPRTRRAWASWNCQLVQGPDGQIESATHYWMNSLQGVSQVDPFFVSLNGGSDLDPRSVQRIIPYSHPLFDLSALRAQAEIPDLNAAAAGTTQTYFAGAYQRYGFHEDGLWSAVRLCELLLGENPWQARGRPAG